MSKCPKCGCFRIIGPFYGCRNNWVEGLWEYLEYVCADCGYRKKVPTLDAETPQPDHGGR